MGLFSLPLAKIYVYAYYSVLSMEVVDLAVIIGTTVKSGASSVVRVPTVKFRSYMSEVWDWALRVVVWVVWYWRWRLLLQEVEGGLVCLGRCFCRGLDTVLFYLSSFPKFLYYNLLLISFNYSGEFSSSVGGVHLLGLSIFPN